MSLVVGGVKVAGEHGGNGEQGLAWGACGEAGDDVIQPTAAELLGCVCHGLPGDRAVSEPVCRTCLAMDDTVLAFGCGVGGFIVLRAAGAGAVARAGWLGVAEGLLGNSGRDFGSRACWRQACGCFCEVAAAWPGFRWIAGWSGLGTRGNGRVWNRPSSGIACVQRTAWWKDSTGCGFFVLYFARNLR